MLSILDKIKNYEIVTHLENQDGHFVIQDTLAFSLTISAVFAKKPQKILINCPNLYSAQDIYEHITSVLGEDDVLFFPQDEIFRVDVNAYSREMLSQRLYCMHECLKNNNKIIITHSSSLTRYLPDPKVFEEHCIKIKVGNEFDIKKLVNTITKQGYKRVNKIDGPLQFAQRGDIVDVFPINADRPYRIEFFDVEVESIRQFDISSQLSDKEFEEISILPALDIILTDEERERLPIVLREEAKKAQFRIGGDEYYKLLDRTKDLIDNINENGFDENYYNLYQLLVTKPFDIIDYVKPDLAIEYDSKQCKTSMDLLLSQIYDYFSELYKGGISLPLYNPYENLDDAYLKFNKLIKTTKDYSGVNDFELPIRGITKAASNIFKAIEMIKEYNDEGKKVIICLDETQYDSFKQYLDEYEIKYEEINPNDIPNENLGITHEKLIEGFEFYREKLVILSQREIYGYRPKVTRYLQRFKNATILKSYDELQPGDYVVHEECGIGCFDSITTLTVSGMHKDFLKIQYAGTGVLYVPLEQFKLVRKYVSKEGAVPKVNKLGGGEWEKTKKKIKERVNLLADRLIKLYAERNATPGYAFKPDDEFQAAFEKAFPYPLTEDQQKAVDEIKRDMESPHPMDRLLCGDVGFGKTEVAFRAAFKAILSGQQVALLCPTTLLARQHYEKALERFSLFGVNVCMFSRFVPQSHQNEQIKQIKEGKIHFIIGTHRILSKEIEIPNLKLLIIDEEQRFGVEHKEKIKEMSKNIDVLTLTATPIPRTLQMSLLNIRSLSQLQSAPSNRMPIQTYVIPQSDDVIKEAIEKELARKGQVFYLHNITFSTGSTVTKLQKLIPNARIDVVHGKMDKDEIEEVMAKFYAGEIDILVCTSIIETGLDISNANTILIENADNFGLAQLYQIKGRVGRSNRIAYAYLMYNDKKELSDVARKRLKAIKDFTELGSGFKIAQRDLTIRGAGDILGPEQAGFIDTVGIDMYLKLLNEVVKEKQGEELPQDNIKVSNIQMDAYIPKKYAENDGDKLEIYREIQTISTLPNLEIFKEKLKDIYGKLPSEVELLLRKRKIDILSSSIYIESMVEENGGATVVLTQEASKLNRIGILLFENLGRSASYIRATFADRKIRLRLNKTMNYLDHLEKMLQAINDSCMNLERGNQNEIR
jgi:transcription-repair coupling factor (superfamily II helicase)